MYMYMYKVNVHVFLLVVLNYCEVGKASRGMHGC